jgi:hypothetical protein
MVDPKISIHQIQEEKCDMESVKFIVNILEQLCEEAALSGVDEVKMVIDSAFKMCLAAHYMLLRENLY